MNRTDWLIPAQVTNHQMAKWEVHARERMDLAAKYLDQRNVVIQAGGNLGIWPWLLASEYRFQLVYTFEPDPGNFNCLVVNTRPVQDVVICYNSALGRCAGTTGWLKDHKGRPGWHKVAPDDTATAERVQVVAIDEVPIPDRVDLIALDVEGFELEALMGAERTLYRDKPVVIVEDLHRSKFRSFRQLGGIAYGHPVGKLQEWLRGRGYRKAEAVHNDEIWVHG